MTSLKPWGYGEIGVRDSISLGLNAPDLTGWRGNGVAPFSGFQSGIYGQAKGGLPHFMNAGRSQAGRGTQMTGAFGPAQGHYLGAVNTGNRMGQAVLPAAGYYNQQMNTNPFDTANQFATNPYVGGMVDASSRDIVRNLGENVLPGIAGQSASTGNLGSSRRGALEAIATRGAADRIGDISSQLRGGLYSQGLNTGYNQANFGAQGLEGLGRLGFQQANLGASGLMGVGQAGMGMQNQGFNQYQNAMNSGWNMGSQMQNQQQRMIDYQRNRHYQDQMLPFQQAQIMSGLSMAPAQAFGSTPKTMVGTDYLNMGAQLGTAAIMAGAGNPMGAAGMAGSALPNMLGGGPGGMSRVPLIGNLYNNPMNPTQHANPYTR